MYSSGSACFPNLGADLVEIFRLDGLIIQDVSGTSSIYSNEIRCFGTRDDWDDLGANFDRSTYFTYLLCA